MNAAASANEENRLFLILIVILTIVWSVNPPSASAQDARISMGGRIGYNFDADNLDSFDNGTAVLGLIAHFRPTTLPIIINPGMDYYRNGRFGSVALQFDANGLYPFELSDTDVTPYAGLGFDLTTLNDIDNVVDGDINLFVDPGVNLIGGAAYATGSTRPFIQARYTLGSHRVFQYVDRDDEGNILGFEDGSGFQITVGLLFTLDE